MSKYAIVQRQFYEGKWTLKNLIDYVVFPTGLQLDKDGKHVWISFGTSDKFGYIAKWELSGLIDSLDFVCNCNI